MLSPREREILRWLAAGLRTDRIAFRLGVKPVTIHMHLKSARRKLGARTREQMMAIAVRHRLF
jgi:DNA-binding CsgD family transcriptional regulator